MGIVLLASRQSRSSEANDWPLVCLKGCVRAVQRLSDTTQ